jgi:PIN domain nuclease of toxin-antitoxin system
MNCLLDTCAVLFWTLEPERLSRRARERIDGAGDSDLLLCSMSLWEIAWKHKMGRLELGMDVREYLSRLRRLPLEMVPVGADLWIRNVNLDWDHKDPVDRTIVALASHRRADLVTSDGRIRDFYDRTVW